MRISSQMHSDLLDGGSEPKQSIGEENNSDAVLDQFARLDRVEHSGEGPIENDVFHSGG